jgi:hypothetical protein
MNRVITTTLTDSIDGKRIRLDPIRVGRVPVTLGTPDRYVTVVKDDEPVLRIDVYAYGPDCFAFEEVIIWHDMVIIGFGSHVHAVSTADRSVVTIELGSYFGHLYPSADYLLVASGERLFRFEADRSLQWKSDVLAIDGVVVHDVGPVVIRGEGEWDPPGGWKPFAIAVVDGKTARQPVHP